MYARKMCYCFKAGYLYVCEVAPLLGEKGLSLAHNECQRKVRMEASAQRLGASAGNRVAAGALGIPV